MLEAWSSQAAAFVHVAPRLETAALSAEMAPKITAALIPESWHKPIEHGMAVIKGAGAPAKAFADYVRGSEARAILEKNGFSVPGA